MISSIVNSIRQQSGEFLVSAFMGDERIEPKYLANKKDPGLFGPDSSAWIVHSDSASMLIGGLRALLMQTLHPLAMAGVAEHSDYEVDPWGRLRRTGRFIGATTFGNTEFAEQSIQLVNSIHTRVVGQAPDGRKYSASDPRLLLWVHVTEVDSFLKAQTIYGDVKLSRQQKDSYVSEMSVIAEKLGAKNVPKTLKGLEECLSSFEQECVFEDQAKEAVKFLLVAPVPVVAQVPYSLITGAALTSMPTWVSEMLNMNFPKPVEPLLIRPACKALSKAFNWSMSAVSPIPSS